MNLKKLTVFFLLLLPIIPFCVSCNPKILFSPVPITPTPTPLYLLPTSTPGCYSAGSLPATQYSFPNPLPVMTPFWTPVVPAPVTVTGTTLSYSDDGDYQAYILRSQA